MTNSNDTHYDEVICSLLVVCDEPETKRDIELSACVWYFWYPIVLTVEAAEESAAN